MRDNIRLPRRIQDAIAWIGAAGFYKDVEKICLEAKNDEDAFIDLYDFCKNNDLCPQGMAALDECGHNDDVFLLVSEFILRNYHSNRSTSPERKTPS